MEKQNTLNSRILKILIPFAVIYGIIYLAKAGYAFGQWFQQWVN